MKNSKTTQKEKLNGEKEYAGVAINVADDDKVTPEMVKNRVKVQNNNPRNNDMY